MVILISVLLLTTNVVMSSRKTTGDTCQAARAQYAAESATTMARTRLAQAATLLRKLNFAFTVEPSELQYALQATLCGGIFTPQAAQVPAGNDRARQRPQEPVYCDVSALQYSSANPSGDPAEVRLQKASARQHSSPTTCA